MDNKVGYTVDEYARLEGCDHKTIRSGIASGQIPSYRIGRLIRIPGWWVRLHLDGPRSGDHAA
jgi:excisionase family DNA binding protein